MRLSVRIGKGDLEIKRKQAEKFLNRGDKVKIEVILRGRENAHPDVAIGTINTFIKAVEESIEVRTEQKPVRQGRKFNAIIAKK